MSDFEKKYYDLLGKVAEMRKWQKDYFRCSSGTTLTKAKACEKRVDDIVTAEAGRSFQLQQKMF